VNAIARLVRLLAALTVAGALGACATIPAGAGSNPVDPWEVYNRHVFDLNDRVDRAVLKPVAQFYEDVVPEPARECFNNAFRNLGEPLNAVNNLLQAKPTEAMTDVLRFLWNSTVGLLGCIDISAKAGAPRSNEDFGQTLGVWGFQPGPYFVLPILGPSSVRDTAGRVFDFLGTDPLWYLENIRLRNSLVGWRIVDTRASLLPAERVLDAAAIDRYQFVRDAYLQLRRNLVYDGNPPRLPDPDDEDFDNGPRTDAGTSTASAGQPDGPVGP
jgi:phospholipid-binding lipoprotein MlaA